MLHMQAFVLKAFSLGYAIDPGQCKAVPKPNPDAANVKSFFVVFVVEAEAAAQVMQGYTFVNLVRRCLHIYSDLREQMLDL